VKMLVVGHGEDGTSCKPSVVPPLWLPVSLLQERNVLAICKRGWLHVVPECRMRMVWSSLECQKGST
jgi:hypothetical protein